jgi:hypothetical protein
LWVHARRSRRPPLSREGASTHRSTSRRARKAFKGAERGAESLSVRPFQSIVESIQNGDDLGATELRIGLRSRRGQRIELIVHNGARISLLHVGAMVPTCDPLAGEHIYDKLGTNSLGAPAGADISRWEANGLTELDISKLIRSRSRLGNPRMPSAAPTAKVSSPRAQTGTAQHGRARLPAPSSS